MLSGNILIVEDETSLLEFLSVLCSGEGLSVTTARSVREARERLAERTPDLVLCDMLMPDGNGLELLREIKGGDSRTSVIMMTAYTSTKNAIDAMKLGAYDYVPKPFDIDELKAVLERALEKNRLYEENTYLRRELEQRYAFKNIIGRSPKMQAIFGIIERVARTASTVLIHGESGTGKELIARAIHFSSPPPSACWRSTAARCPRTCSRASSSGTSAAPSPARCATRRAFSRRPITARCSSTRSGK